MATKKKVTQAATTLAAPTAEHPEYATEFSEPFAESATEESEVRNDREEQIRQAAYAAFERRGGQGGSPEQDWLDAETQWELSRNR